MKATELFIKSISDFIQRESENDKEFAKKVAEQPKKTAEAACNFIMVEVQRTKRCGWADEEIYGLVRHFYDEKELKDPGAKNNISRVVINQHVDLSENDKAIAMGRAEIAFKKQLEREHEEQQAIEKEKEKKAKQAKIEKARQKKEAELSMMGDLFGGV